jgi:hypothetical protein
LTRLSGCISADFGMGVSPPITPIIKPPQFGHLPRQIRPLIPFDFHLR